MSKAISLCRRVRRFAPVAAVLVAVLAAVLLGAAQTPVFAQPAAITDTELTHNMAALQAMPATNDLSWRQYHRSVAGNPNPELPAVKPFVAPDALQTALAYSDEHNGLGVLVWHSGALVGEAYKEGLSADDLFATYSQHKTVVALTVLAAIEDGILPSLDVPVGNYLNEWRDDARGRITLRQLLEQTSGLKHYSLAKGEMQAAALAAGGDPDAAALGTPIDGTPGEVFNYTNVNYQAAGIVLSRALAKAGKDYASYLSARLWAPIGNGEARLWQGQPEAGIRFSAGLEATLGDWLRLGLFIAAGGAIDGKQLIDRELIQALLAPSASNPAYGLGIWRGESWEPLRSYGPGTPFKVPHSAPYLAADVYYTDGFGGQRVYIVPSRDLVVARVGNADMSWDDAVMLNALLRGIDEAAQRENQAAQ